MRRATWLRGLRRRLLSVCAVKLGRGGRKYRQAGVTWVDVEPLEARVLLTFPAPFTQADSCGMFDDVLDTSAEGKPKVLANDMDMNGDPMTAQLVSAPAHGTLTLNGNGHFVYTPTLGYVGSDSFVYQPVEKDAVLRLCA